MKSEIFIELFRFNERTDYLPYHLKYTLEYSENETINDLLNKINKIEAFGFEQNCNLKINEIYMNASELVKDIVARDGNEIVIDPISELRAKKDLIIDRSDFINKFSLIEKYLEAEENIAYRKSTELAYYASNTLNYNRKYIGDHVLIIAADLIEKDFKLKNEIVDLLIDAEDGIWYHTSIENRMLSKKEEEKIQKVVYLCLQRIKPKTKLAKKVASMCNKTKAVNFEEANQARQEKVSQGFSGFNIAVYNGVKESGLQSLVRDAQATLIKIESRNEDLAPNSSIIDRNFSYKIAGDVLMQAKDANADFVLVKNDLTKEFFDKNQAKMQKLTGRELGMIIVSQDQFIQLLEGEKDTLKLGFNKHKVKISFL